MSVKVSVNCMEGCKVALPSFYKFPTARTRYVVIFFLRNDNFYRYFFNKFESPMDCVRFSRR